MSSSGGITFAAPPAAMPRPPPKRQAPPSAATSMTSTTTMSSTSTTTATPAAAAITAASHPPQSPLSLSLEKLLEAAQASGDLRLAGRNLKTFPGRGFDLTDTVSADLSRNKLSELPAECTDFASLEKLILYHNSIRAIPETVVCLQSLQFLDLSRNQLSYLPPSICSLPCLQGLVVHNNRLVSLPEEIGRMATLMELDASCNEITHLPVQIGDLAALRRLNLRRNHLQEVPVELSYLQLNSLDLSRNRITALPVELRFMTTVVYLNLGENPLTCPPANLCSRGRVHVFKYLEIQAIKEDRKRGVLSDVEYRRSYRKTAAGGGQLSDFRFANGFNADARRKRHTADSGYGSEQPLDRRWSQEFSQDVLDMHTQDARRIVLRANRPNNNSVGVACKSNGYAPAPATTPLGSNNSSLSSSSGYASGPILEQQQQHQHQLRVLPPSASSSSSNGSLGDVKKNTDFHKDKTSDLPDAGGGEAGASARTESPDDHEKEERRRAAQKVLGQHGRPATLPRRVDLKPSSGSTTPRVSTTLRSVKKMPPKPPINSRICDHHKGGPSMKLPLTPPNKPVKSQLPSPRHNQPLPVPSSVVHSTRPLPTPDTSNNKPGASGLPKPQQQPNCVTAKQQQQTYRQYKEHLRQQRQSESTYLQQQQQLRRINGDFSEIQQLKTTKVSVSGSKLSTTTRTTVMQQQQQQQYDVKTMQKEAVLSYVKSKQASSNPSLDTTSPVKQQQQHRNSSNASHGGLMSSSSRSVSTSNIPQPTGSSSSLYNGSSTGSSSKARRDAEKAASAEAHITQLRMHIESRLRITLPDDLASSLQDGVVLCHIANHIKPRAVPSIHVPSPAVPKLNPAKCRRNVENFLLACRKLGVREDELFSLEQLYPEVEVADILATLVALVDVAFSSEPPESGLLQILPEEQPQNFPDLVPREELMVVAPAATGCGGVKTTTACDTPGRLVETLCLLALFLGTLAALYLFKPQPYFQ